MIVMVYEDLFPRCSVAGWGYQVFGPDGYIQTTIKKVDVPIIDPETCQSLLRTTRLGPSFTLDSDSFICAGGEENKDACTVSFFLTLTLNSMQ